MADTGETIEIQGPQGAFRIATAGGMPDLPYAFLYEDNRHRFFFYADVVAPFPPEFDIVVKEASVQRLEGPAPRFPQEDVLLIEQNILHFLNSRQFHWIKDVITSQLDRPRKVIFTWRIQS